MALSLLNKLRLRAGESIDTTDPTDPDNPNQAIIDRYKNVPGVNVEKLTEYVNLNIPEPQTIVDAIILAEAIGYTPEQAKVVGAQWVLESGRGISTAGADYNYFGIKSHNESVMKRMSEQYGIDVSAGETVSTAENAKDGTRYLVNTSFASFKNPIEGFLGKKAFLETNKRYKDALNPKNTADQFAQGLQDAGYATVADDEGNLIYKKKLASIYNGRMRTTRPTWMEPTRKSNVPQAAWTMTEVQPTEGSRADLVAEEAEETPIAEAVTEAAPVVKTKEPYFTISPIPSDQDLSQLPGGALGNDIVYTPSTSTNNPFEGEQMLETDEILSDINYTPQVPGVMGYTDEEVANYVQNKENFEKIKMQQASDKEELTYNQNPRNFDNYFNLTKENLSTGSEQISPVSEEQILEKQISPTTNEKTIPIVEEDINMKYLDSIPEAYSTISPGTFTNERRNKTELKQAAAAEKFIMNPLQKSAKQGYFGSGQSIFYPSTIQNKNGGAMAKNIPTWNYPSEKTFVRDTTSLPFKTGGSMYPRYFKNGGTGDELPDPPDKYQQLMAELEAARLKKQNTYKKYTDENTRAGTVMDNAHRLGLELGTNEETDQGEKTAKGINLDWSNSNAGGPNFIPRTINVQNAQDWEAIGMPFINDPQNYLNNLVGKKKDGTTQNVQTATDQVDAEGDVIYEDVLNSEGKPTPHYYQGFGCIGAQCGIYNASGATQISDYGTGYGSEVTKAGEPIYKQLSNAFWDADDQAALIAAGFERTTTPRVGSLARIYSPDYTAENPSYDHTAMVNKINSDGTGVDFDAEDGFIENSGSFKRGIHTSSPWNSYKGKIDYYNYVGNTSQYKKESEAAKDAYLKTQRKLSTYWADELKNLTKNFPLSEVNKRVSPKIMPLTIRQQSYPDTRKGRKQKKQDNAYIAAYMAKMQKK